MPIPHHHCSRNRNNPPESGHRFDHNRGTVPLAVDLDGTLSRTDTLHEAALALVAGLGVIVPK